MDGIETSREPPEAATKMEVDTSAPETSGTRLPSPDFLKRRHERMRTRRHGGPPEDDEEEDVTPQTTTETKLKSVDENNSLEEKESDSKSSEDNVKVCKLEPLDTTLAENPVVTKKAISTASPTALRSFRQLREKRKNRVPGGAAAKLIGKAETQDDEDAKDDKEDDETADLAPATEEFIKIRDETKAVFESGNKEARRFQFYSADVSGESPESQPTTTGNRLLNRKDLLHETPTAAVLSLLGGGDEVPKLPHNNSSFSKRHDGIPSISSSRSREQPPPPKDFTQTPAMEVTSRSVFQAPPRKDELSSVASGSSGTGPRQPNSVPSEELRSNAKGKNPLEQPLLSKKAEQRVAQMKEHMRDPNSTLSDLISIIASPDNQEPGHTFSRGDMVRRKNACGALQVMTSQNAHRVNICWTLGVLPALSSVLEDSGTRDLAVEFPDVPTRKEFIDARKRAVSALMNLSVPPENRLAVFHTPRLVANIVRVIKLDQYEARKGCCSILAQLAKSKENRLLMVQVPGLIDAITAAIEPKVIIVPPMPVGTEDDESTRSPDRGFNLHHSGSGSSADPASSGSYTSGEAPKEKKEDGKYAVDVTSVPTQDPAKAARRYDEDSNEHLHAARVNIFALLSHLVKEKDNAYILARHKFLMDTLVEISKLHDSPSHEYAVKLIAHLTRHRGNSKHMVFKLRKIVPALVKASFSQNDEVRKYACFALQNLAQDKPCRQELAVTDQLLTALCVRIRQASDPEERLAAIHALKNLTDEPANLIPMTNTPECFATMMQIAHAGDDSVTEMMQYLGCDALATLSHWFRSIATSGQRIDLNKKGLSPSMELFVPSLKIVAYEQWQ